MEPLVSVVMPVYNMDKYLRASIDSVLKQSYSDFEFIIINDGSADGSAAIINSYNDKRINVIHNPSNKGLVYSLNAGVDKARGLYIARIDGDDIALTERFARQVQYFNAHPECDVLTTTASLIDKDGKMTGEWPADRRRISFKQIRSYLPKDNCLVHPSAMIKTDVLKSFKYSYAQALAEDYDLWLRLIAAGKQIHKLDEPLTLHRILATSFTRTRKKNGYYKIMQVKQVFFKEQWKAGKINFFTMKTLFFSFIDAIIGTEKEIKYFLKRLINKKE
jgi:glycosyltransferase involved in cell wall biosynthesis